MVVINREMKMNLTRVPVFSVSWEAKDMLSVIQVENPEKRIVTVLTPVGPGACKNTGTSFYAFCFSKVG